MIQSVHGCESSALRDARVESVVNTTRTGRTLSRLLVDGSVRRTAGLGHCLGLPRMRPPANEHHRSSIYSLISAVMWQPCTVRLACVSVPRPSLKNDHTHTHSHTQRTHAQTHSCIYFHLGGYIFTCVCLSVCLSVNTIAYWSNLTWNFMEWLDIIQGTVD